MSLTVARRCTLANGVFHASLRTAVRPALAMPRRRKHYWGRRKAKLILYIWPEGVDGQIVPSLWKRFQHGVNGRTDLPHSVPSGARSLRHGIMVFLTRSHWSIVVPRRLSRFQLVADLQHAPPAIRVLWSAWVEKHPVLVGWRSMLTLFITKGAGCTPTSLLAQRELDGLQRSHPYSLLRFTFKKRFSRSGYVS